ncbi:hypothetical protein B0H10DRAFT_2207262 [Mycena sp. CBHHK59/15]|nr:hypothetical protein B0H10DRAFT_2207262 [Mycena sp. CBHHK59/15]
MASEELLFFAHFWDYGNLALSTLHHDHGTSAGDYLRNIYTGRKPARKPSRAQEQRFLESRCAASVKYRERNRSKVLEAGRLRAAKRRAQQKDDEGPRLMPERQALDTAPTTFRNREELALKQRKVRKQAFIKKHSVHAYIQWRFNAPIPSREVDEEDDADDDHQGVHNDDYRYDASAAPLICDYNDPFLKRCWLARTQTDNFSNSHCKAVKSWEDVLAYWDEFCSKNHGDGCPAFKPIDFSLTPSESYPLPASCTHPPRAAAAPPAPVAPPSPFASYTSSMGSTSTSSLSDSECTSTSLPGLASPTPQKAPLSPFPKKEESAGPDTFFTGPRITPNTRIVLSPSGQACAATLAASFLSGPAVAARRTATIMTTPCVPDNSPATPPPGPVTPGPAPVTPARTARPSVHSYGIRGVAVFYPSHDAAKTAATKLGLVNAKIMVSDNPDKLEAWMTNQPFVREDDE